MVSDRRICKVADFGLSRLMKTKKRTEQDATDGVRDSLDDYYAATPGQEKPIKWTAPEGIFHNRFSTASDAWSYAITIVEILQNGNKPYTVPKNLKNTAVIHYLNEDKNFIHPKPADCSDVLYSLLTDCWKREPVDRPSFEDILTRLGRIMNESSQLPATQANQHEQSARNDAPTAQTLPPQKCAKKMKGGVINVTYCGNRHFVAFVCNHLQFFARPCVELPSI